MTARQPTTRPHLVHPSSGNKRCTVRIKTKSVLCVVRSDPEQRALGPLSPHSSAQSVLSWDGLSASSPMSISFFLEFSSLHQGQCKETRQAGMGLAGGPKTCSATTSQSNGPSCKGGPWRTSLAWRRHLPFSILKSCRNLRSLAWLRRSSLEMASGRSGIGHEHLQPPAPRGPPRHPGLERAAIAGSGQAHCRHRRCPRQGEGALCWHPPWRCGRPWYWMLLLGSCHRAQGWHWVRLPSPSQAMGRMEEQQSRGGQPSGGICKNWAGRPRTGHTTGELRRGGGGVCGALPWAGS